MILENEIVTVTVSAEQQAASSTGQSLTCLFGASTVLPSGERFGLYTNLAAVGATFPQNSPEYLAAQVFFGQQAGMLMIARMFAAAVPAEIIGAVTGKQLADFHTINNGSLSISIDGVAENIVGIDLTGAASLAGVAAAIQTAIDATKAGVTVSYSGTQFILRSGTTGVTSTLAVATAAPAGTDLAPLLGFRAQDQPILTQGQAAETVAQSLAAVYALNPFYFLSLVYSPVDADIEAAATWALAQGCVLGYTTSAPGCPVAATNTDIGSVLKTSTNNRVIGAFDLAGNNPFLIVSALARRSMIDYTGTDTDEILMFKQLPGCSVSNINTTQRKALDGKNLNYYLNVGSNPMFATGVMADGSWIDQVQGLDWLSSALRDVLFQGFYGSKKIDQDDRGMARLAHLMTTPLEQGVSCGLLAPGVWNGNSLGQIKTGQRLTTGYYIYWTSVDNQTQVQRNTRIAPSFQILAKGGGAFQGANILLNFEQ